MKDSRTLIYIFLLVLPLASVVSATDYRPDTSYPDLGFTSTDVVYDVFVHPDGRYLVAGEDFTGNASVPYLKRFLRTELSTPRSFQPFRLPRAQAPRIM